MIPGSATYDTDTHMLVSAVGAATQPAHAVVRTPTGSIDVLFVRDFLLSAGATLTVTGSLPFGIAAIGNVEITGVLDVSAGGAGARTAAACSASQGQNGDNHIGGGYGAGGGGYHGKGGSGTQGDAGQGTASFGIGGAKIDRPADLLGGCSGGKGGDGQGLAGGGGGGGGGAVVIATPGTITIAGAIDVGGGGGKGGQGGNAGAGGGGGGGSGGMILLECKTLEQGGALVANGGGGGEGGYSERGADGAPGTRTPLRARGGESIQMGGGNGGDGGAGASHDGQPAPYPGAIGGGGGGGGGGTGYIAVACPSLANTGVISPPFAPWP